MNSRNYPPFVSRTPPRLGNLSNYLNIALLVNTGSNTTTTKQRSERGCIEKKHTTERGHTMERGHITRGDRHRVETHTRGGRTIRRLYGTVTTLRKARE